jgi:hypothetical protein
MSTRKLTQALSKLMRSARQFIQSITKAFVNWFLRILFLAGRTSPAGGFILPTTILLLLVVSLSIGAITYRSFSRTNETIADRQQRVVYNAATPAIDRAKAKLEYMFNRERDNRLPSGIPPELTLVDMMLNDPNSGYTQRLLPNGDDPYTFPGDANGAYGAEERIDVDGDGANDNAWRYRADTDGDGDDDAWVAYSLIFRSPQDFNDLTDQRREAWEERADAMQIRNAPLSNTNQANPACATNTGTQPEAGWFPDQANTSIVRKNFQVDVYVLPDDRNNTVSTLEFQQDREYSRGNKWGAWFRNDLEVFPGPQFNWNGAMHTEGSLIVGNNRFDAYLISSPFSCLYTRQASEVTVGNLEDSDPNTDGNQPYLGQAMSGKVGSNRFENENPFHLFVDGDDPIVGGNDVKFDRNSDSTVNNGPGPADYSLDPVFLLTEDRSKPRNVPGDDTSNYQDNDWNQEDSPFVREGRIYQQSEDPPYVDDAYRADNRFGPNARIGGVRIPQLGETIDDDLVSQDGETTVTQEEMIRTEGLAGDANAANVGLDGYWERRADAEGLKLIVGQRLELGDTMGWGGIANGQGQTAWDLLGEDEAPLTEPLRPWNECTAVNDDRCHEARQRRTLYDNLAAVQSLAVYHFEDNSELPTACMALTVHPGTPATLANSATFQDLNRGNWGGINGTYPLVISDFFHGYGTNGWEYEVPEASDFDGGTPLMRALANLANYAGDPNGGSPSFTPVQDDIVHPYPSMAMWGDYSILRRILNSDDGGPADPDFGGYDNLSPSDKTTLQTAACTLGMLAYNVDYLLRFDYTDPGTVADLEKLNDYILHLYNGQANPNLAVFKDPIINQPLAPNNAARAFPGNKPPAWSQNNNNFVYFDDANRLEERLTPDSVIAALRAWRDSNGLTAAQENELDQMINLAEIVSTREQIIRDLNSGFEPGVRPLQAGNGCDVESFLDTQNVPPNFYTLDGARALVSLCSDYPKYPILYAIFPGRDRSESQGGDRDRLRDEVDRDVHIDYIEEVNDRPNTYTEIDFGIAEFIQPGGNGRLARDTELSEIALKPLPLNDWVLPHETDGNDDTPAAQVVNHIKTCLNGSCDYRYEEQGDLVRIPFKDSALMNGREMMTVRVLDLDLEMMKDNTFNGNYWLPVNDNDTGGIIYAFREDAVSEGAIVRPSSGGNWTACGNNTSLQNNNNCLMRAGDVNAYQSTDPPLNDENLISPKPVDYAPDPDRRPHGFRLRNGAIISRPNRAQAGMTFISDNPAYLQGDFNLHQNGPNGQRLEEFRDLLNQNFGNFYRRDNLDPRFSRPDGDLWRPAEILADAITMLPDNQCDGSMEDTFVNAGNNGTPGNTGRTYNCNGNNNRTSFINTNRPDRDPGGSYNTLPRTTREATEPGWMRQNPLDPESPILVSANGNGVKTTPPGEIWSPVLGNDFEYGSGNREDYFEFRDNKQLIGSQETRQNAIIVSGLVPSRPGQSYGGLHNFPRFITTWPNLFISGSLLQLNFSRYATSPFDQSAWEPGDNPGNELIRYYSPPNRRWGYDVGLQYAPAGPLSSRFISAERTRNEFYDEPPADDPYMINLCESLGDVADANCN